LIRASEDPPITLKNKYTVPILYGDGPLELASSSRGWMLLSAKFRMKSFIVPSLPGAKPSLDHDYPLELLTRDIKGLKVLSDPINPVRRNILLRVGTRRYRLQYAASETSMTAPVQASSVRTRMRDTVKPLIQCPTSVDVLRLEVVRVAA